MALFQKLDKKESVEMLEGRNAVNSLADLVLGLIKIGVAKPWVVQIVSDATQKQNQFVERRHLCTVKALGVVV
jgi:hypothetical protein